MANLRQRLMLGLGALALCVGLGASATPAAEAGLLGCGAGSQPFAAVDGDANSYVAMPNGGFESGSYGWTLRGGASVVSGNEPWSVQGGSHSLALPSGSTAIGPSTCIGLLSPMLRMFASDAGGTDGGLQVTVEYRSLLGGLLGIQSYTGLPGAGYPGWRPSAYVTIPLGVLGGIPLATASFRMRLTPIGSGSRWRVDDVFVDPWLSRTA